MDKAFTCLPMSRHSKALHLITVALNIIADSFRTEVVERRRIVTNDVEAGLRRSGGHSLVICRNISKVSCLVSIIS